jgi:Rod binding domain-containing protein
VSAPAFPALVTAAPQDLAAQALPGPGASKEKNAAAARQFEALLMANMFKEMRQTVHPSGLFGNDTNAQSTYEYLLDQAVTTSALKGGKGYGIAQKLEAAWDRQTPKS